MPDIAATAKIYPNVRLGKGVRIGPWAIVGLPPDGIAPGEFATIIGEGSVIRSHSVVYGGSRIGPGFQTGHRTIVGPGMDVGTRCSIGTSTIAAGFIRLHDGARIHGHDYVGEFACLNEKAWVGPYNIVESQLDSITSIGAGAILTMSVHILPGVRVGERALVGMRSLLRQDVPPYRVVVGNPPRGIRTIDQVVSPIPNIGRPYEPDPPETQAAALARHDSRSDCCVDETDWRVEMWHRLRAAEHAVGNAALKLPQTSDRLPVPSVKSTRERLTL